MRDAVRAVVDQKAAEREADRRQTAAMKKRVQRRKSIRTWQALALFVVFVVSLVLAIPSWREPFQAPTGAEAERNARQGLVFAASLVNRYIEAHGQPPRLLSDVGVELPGVHFAQLDHTWTVSTRVNDQVITYRSGDDPAQFIEGR